MGPSDRGKSRLLKGRARGREGMQSTTRSRTELWVRVVALLTGLAALTDYLLPKLANPDAHWPLWNVNVYWWGGQQAAHDAALYTPDALYHFVYPPFAAAIFGIGADAQVSFLKLALTAGSLLALGMLCWLALGATGVQRRPETVFAVMALALLTAPVGITLHLGEVNLILAALVGVDLLRRDGGRWQGVATGLAAGIKLTPLIFVAYLLITRRVRTAAVAIGTFAGTVAFGFVLLPSQSQAFWLEGVFMNERRVANPANPGNQSLAGAVARLAGGLDAARPWWLAAALLTGLAGLAIAAWAHRRGHRLAGVVCCAITGLLVSPISWVHHWVWVVPLLVMLAATAWRRRSLWYGLATAVVAIVFSEFIPLPSPGSRPDMWRLLAGDPYVLCGLAVLAGAVIALARERSVYWPESSRGMLASS
jgi:alpha-1,2-mannosyltransferase